MRFYRTIANFIEHYRSLFLNPAENVAEIIITTALIAVGALIAWMAVSILVNGGRSFFWRWKHEPGYRFRFFLYLGLVTGLAALVLIGGNTAVSSSAFCGRACHSMNPQYQSWRRSSHVGVSCSSCHVEGTFSGLIVHRLAVGPARIKQEFVGKLRRPINAESDYSRRRVPDSRCLGCHLPKKRSYDRRTGFKMDHQAHLKSRLRCTTCHNRVAHPRAENYSPIRNKVQKFKYRNYLTMREGCWRCHRKGGKYIDIEGQAHVGPYRTYLGRRAPTDCVACHTNQMLKQLRQTAKKVRDRHFKTPPWKRGVVHGEIARKVGFKPCQVCHNPAKRCTVCHQGITMPHARTWVDPKEHGYIAKATKTSPCRMCHTVGTVPRCAANGHHHKKLATEYRFDLKAVDWKVGKERHGVVAKATGGAPCFRCHEQSSWCTTQCHQGVTMPHASGWRKVHFNYVGYVSGDGWQRDSAPCQMCHNKDGKAPNYCFDCHHKRFSAATPLALMFKMRDTYKATFELDQNVRLPCEDCHIHRGLDFCRKCHLGQDQDKRKNITLQ